MRGWRLGVWGWGGLLAPGFVGRVCARGAQAVALAGLGVLLNGTESVTVPIKVG